MTLIAETELWPNYFWEAKRHGAKVAIINGRISERSLKRYQRLGSLFVRAIKCADLIMAQTAHDVERFMGTGSDDRYAPVVGEKFDHVQGGSLLAGAARKQVLDFVDDEDTRIGMSE